MGNFNASKCVDDIVEWIRKYFETNARPDTKAVIGISGGKDSSICAALCVKALGKDRVLGVLMPNGIQPDFGDSTKVCQLLDIKCIPINIEAAFSSLAVQITTHLDDNKDMRINLPPRLRMTTLYAVAQAIPEGGRVVNTSNYSERIIGYSTKYGDSVGDFSPLGELTVTEVKAIGHELGLPKYLVDKPPADGLSGMTDEEKIGFTYEQLDDYILNWPDTKTCDSQTIEKIKSMIKASEHKRAPMPGFIMNQSYYA